MAKKSLLSIAPKSEFSGEVLIPSPDRAPDLVEFTFKYRDREALDAWVKLLEAGPNSDKDPLDADIEMVMDCATGWELSDEFTSENVRTLLIEHPGAAVQVYRTYVRLSRVGREKN